MLNALCFENDVRGVASWGGGMMADVRNLLRFLVLELRETNCMGDPG